MTAAVIVQLAQEGRLDLDDPISKYVSGVPDGDRSRPAVRVRHRPIALRTEHAVFPRRRDAWLQLVHGLRSRRSACARRVDQPDRIGRLLSRFEARIVQYNHSSTPTVRHHRALGCWFDFNACAALIVSDSQESTFERLWIIVRLFIAFPGFGRHQCEFLIR
jgi:hypothetical protein